MFLLQQTTKIKPSWKNFILAESQKPYFQQLSVFLEKQYQTQKIAPKAHLIFHCLEYFEAMTTKLVIIGQDPYSIPNVADGLAFSTHVLNYFPRSLQNIFREIKNDFNITRTKYNLSDIANQNVLLINNVLTVLINQPNSHANVGWEIFLRNLIIFLSSKNQKIIYLLMGKKAQSLTVYIQKSLAIITTSHPSPFSYKISLQNSQTFLKINKLLEEYSLKAIKW